MSTTAGGRGMLHGVQYDTTGEDDGQDREDDDDGDDNDDNDDV